MKYCKFIIIVAISINQKKGKINTKQNFESGIRAEINKVKKIQNQQN